MGTFQTIKPNKFYRIISVTGLLLSFIILFNIGLSPSDMFITYLTYYATTCLIFSLRRQIKLPFVTDLVDFQKDPVYKYDRDGKIDEFKVGYDGDTLHWTVVLFPLASIFSYKTMVHTRSLRVNDKEVIEIELENKTPKEIFEAKMKVEEDARIKKEAKKNRIKRINSDYYNNFKK